MTAGRGPRARKSLGQHFLHDRDVLERIAGAVPADSRRLIEIGAGTGELTAVLAERGFHLVAIEIEPRLVKHLRRRFQGVKRLQVVEGDARDLDIGELAGDGAYDVCGNLPYFAANPIVRGLLEAERQPRTIVVMVQKEVGEEMAAPAGKMSLLGISVQVYAEAEVLFDVPAEAFDPPPKVRSAVVRMVVRPEPLVPRERLEAFFEFVSRTFRNPRKQIHNALARGVWLPPEGAARALEMAGIDPMRRPETLAIEEWVRLLDAAEQVRADA